MGWLILLAPLLSAVLITVWTRPNRTVSPLISVAACLISCAVAIGFFVGTVPTPAPYLWAALPGLQLEIGMQIDTLSRVMLLVVTGVGSLIHIFSLGYMRDDAGKSRFFAKLSLFMFSMIGIVVATNFVQMFIFWELVGLSSYLLIGFWFEKDSAAGAANKAFLANRVGDFGFMSGILLFWTLTGSVMFNNEAALHLTNSPWLTTMALLLFCGCVGKSAQLPLHTWLPDAMEGPTPVSALIHAATMVAAGVYMLCRIYFVLGQAPLALAVIAWVGGITSIFAALCAVQQNDIKRILAYSTLSQLGYMVMAVGCGGPVAAMFHLTTHACFKAMLFLGAGSVIHALHHEQDIWKMGGLRKKMPITFLTFLIGTLALAGCPFLFSGFWSKDQIITVAMAKHPVLGFMALFTAFLTTFYMLRLVFVAFLGGSRTPAGTHAHESPAVMTVPLLILLVPTIVIGYPALHLTSLLQPDYVAEESNLVMAGSFVAFFAGLIAAYLAYGHAKSDPLSLPLLRHKFYIDELYDRTILTLQNLVARAAGWIDDWLIGGLLVRGSSVTASCVGEVLRCMQAGNLRGYAFFFALGAAFLLYWTLK